MLRRKLYCVFVWEWGVGGNGLSTDMFFIDINSEFFLPLTDHSYSPLDFNHISIR